MIAVDWGSSNFRACLIEGENLVDRVEAPFGIRQLQGRSCESVLRELCGNWLRPNEQVLISGMAGSREGWVEVPYVDTPAGLAEIAGGIIQIESEHPGQISIIPGMRHLEADGTADVMRGEETQIVGALAETGPDALFCIPGTHSKWIRCRDGRITAFRTWVTGESFELLSKSPLLAKGDEADPENPAFLSGLDHSKRDGGLLRQIFLGRTDMLMGKVRPENLPSMLSGILTGAEISAAASWSDPGETVVLIGGGERLNRVYQKAFDHFGLAWRQLGNDPHFEGMLRLRQLLNSA